MRALLKLSGAIDAVSARLGRILSWLILAAVVVSAVNAIIRKLFDTSSNSWLELQWILFGTVFLLCSAWTLQANEHIRIDIVNNALPKPVRNAIELLGHVLFLLPLTVVMLITSYPFALRSAPRAADFFYTLLSFPSVFANKPSLWWASLSHWWQTLFSLGEQSVNAGGLPQWPAKSLILIGFFLLFVQGISELIKRIAVMRGLIPDPHSGGGLHAAAEAEAERILAIAKAETQPR